jgi:hypothetical protein
MRLVVVDLAASSAVEALDFEVPPTLLALVNGAIK